MTKKLILIPLLIFALILDGQEKALKSLLSDSAMIYASVSLSILNTADDEMMFEYNPVKSLMPASTMKLVSSAAALELLGPDYRFITRLGYSGSLNRHTGLLDGDIIIKGGGDPALGSSYFIEEYNGFLNGWIDDIKMAGIKQITGRVIADDSYYDYQPVPPGWMWEDMGNYYGAGVSGLSVFDNTYEIHLLTSSEGSSPAIRQILPVECRYDLINNLIAEGDEDKGYVYSSPFGKSGWISGTVPVNRDDFVLKASITDPPLVLAGIFTNKLDSAGITVSGNPTTSRIEKIPFPEFVLLGEISSPPLKRIIEVLNHESVNLFAEHLVKELGKVYANSGSTKAGIEIVMKFLNDSGIDATGMFIEDGSGLSPADAINTRGLAMLLSHMKSKGRYFGDYFASLPEAGKEGTLKSVFRDPLFESRLRAKSGSISRVRSYAGFLTTLSDRELAFSIIINNYTGPSQHIISGIENILKETILYK
jgi:D-alanyl-D-alanine carboxypeptidase/D-alanyl-D-alanine-endopeptidase (penicillin-binding protein 4)